MVYFGTKNPACPLTRKIARARRAKLMMTRIPTRSSVQARDRRAAMCSPLEGSTQETFDVFITRSPEQFVRTFKDNLPITKHQKFCVRDAQKIVFGLKTGLIVAVRSVLRGECKCIAHAVRNKYASYVVEIAQGNDEFVYFF